MKQRQPDIERSSVNGRRNRTKLIAGSRSLFWPAAILLLAGGSLAAAGETATPKEAVGETVIEVTAAGASVTPTFDCRTPGTITICTYRGPVKFTYVNDNHLILLYPDPAITGAFVESEVLAEAYEAYWGADVLFFQAFGVVIPSASTELSDPSTFQRQQEFASKAYATLLAAQLGDRIINVQLRGVYRGYLQIDRLYME